MEEPGPSTVMTVRDTTASMKECEGVDFVWLMVDSGACVSCAGEGQFDSQIDEPKKQVLYSVQGVALKAYGEQTPDIKLDDGLRFGS